MAYTTDISILGGLEVRVKVWVQPAEPDVGIFSAYVDDFVIIGVRSKGKTRPYKGNWLDKRIDAKERERICIELAEEEFA